ncbi:hypothetical protein KAM380_053160 [Aeromonas caviae]|nr:hypothetical protein KAM380_053160 [Aeromonas caviae]
MPRKGRKAAPTIPGGAKILGALRTPIATQGRSYKKRATWPDVSLLPPIARHCNSQYTARSNTNIR